MKQATTLVALEYAYSKFVRGDNSPEYAKYLGYLDARDLYPEFVPTKFETYVKELLEGKAAKLVEGAELAMMRSFWNWKEIIENVEKIE